VAFADRGWVREKALARVSHQPARAPRPSRAFTPFRLLLLACLVALALLLLPHHVTIGGYHLHPGFAPYLAPYLFG
jgi:hypothetical protein